MKIVGIDASINSTGLVSLTLDDNLSVINVDYLGFTQVKKLSGPKIVYFKKGDFGNYLDQNLFMQEYVEIFCSGASYVAFEDYAYAAVGKVFHIAEYTGNLKMSLYHTSASIRLYDPPTIKMFATKKGNADKIRMVDEYDNSNAPWQNRPDLNFLVDPNRISSKYDSPRSDIVDAYFIVKLLQLELTLLYSQHGFTIKSIPDKIIQNIFERKTKGNPIPLLNRPFLTIGSKQ